MSDSVPPDYQLRQSHVTPSHTPPLPPRSASPLMRFVWVLTGFNVGFIFPLVLAFLVLPILLPGRNKEAQTEIPQTQVAFVVITPTDSPTEIPPTPTEIPPTPTEIPPTEEAPASIIAEPTATEFPTATPIPPTPTPLPAPPSYNLTGIKFTLQGWNNCGPANITMGLSYYGWTITQSEAAAFLKPDREDKNVSPNQMVQFVNEQSDYRALYRVAGTPDMLRWLISNQFVVIVEKGYDVPREGWYGHYLTLVGYNEDEFIFYDSNLGTAAKPDFVQKTADFDRNWQAFNRTYIIIYPPTREAELQAFLGRDWNEQANWRYAAELARTEAAAEPDNPFTWFNLGTALTMTGEHGTAARAFDQAFNIGLPWRMMWYQFAPYEAYFQASRLEDVVVLAEATIKTTPYVEESYYHLGRVYELWGDYSEARTQYRLAIRYNKNFSQAAEALARLENT